MIGSVPPDERPQDAPEPEAALQGDGLPAPDDRVESALLREEPAYAAAEVAETLGVPTAQVRRLWRALGLPDHGDARAFTDSDVAALGDLVGLVDGELVDLDLAVGTTRAVGQTMARLADWQVGTLVHRVEEIEARGTTAPATAADDAVRLVERLREPFEELLVYAWRRHLAAAVGRIEALGANEEDLHSTEVTVGFADIVSFTALSNQISREDVGDLIERFESRCADVVALQQGRVIKSIGDSVLFVNADPVRALETAEGIINKIGRDTRMPDVRVGLASGSVVLRLGDVFGPPVNLAARLTSVARRNRIIIDAATADQLPHDQFETRRLPARPVRGFGILEPLAVWRH